MYLLDTDVISEMRKGGKANPGVKQVTTTYAESMLPFDGETAHVWGRLRVRILKIRSTSRLQRPR